MDTDIASESAELSQIQILQQAAVAVLAQANQQPALALTLLRG
jgi:flagellin